jgi:hypothetical protein
MAKLPGLPSWQSIYHQVNPLDGGRTYKTDQANSIPGDSTYTAPFYTYGTGNAPGGGGGGGGWGTEPASPSANTNQTTSSRTTSSRSSGGGGGTTFDPTSVWEAQDALNQANNYMGMLDPQRQQFLSNLSSTYNNYRTNLQNQYGRSKGQYDNSVNTANQNRVSANNQIDGKVRQRSNSLQRLLGSAGAGDSEAAAIYAPYAAARTGTQLRNQVNQQYGSTVQDLNYNWGQYQTDYDNSLKQMADEENNQRNSKLAEFLQRQYDLENQKRQAEAALSYAQGGNAAQAKALREAALPRMYQLLQEITSLGNQQITPTAKDINYTATPVDQFTVDDPGAIQGVDPAMADTTSPYYQWLLRQREDDNNFFGY